MVDGFSESGPFGTFSYLALMFSAVLVLFGPKLCYILPSLWSLRFGRPGSGRPQKWAVVPC
jgi:hypothetical protein